MDPQTEVFYTRAPREKWEEHQVVNNPFIYTRTNKVGIYSIYEKDKQRYFSVNLTDESESDINASSIEEKQVELTPPEEVPARQKLWAVFLLLSLVVLLIEWLAWLRIE